MLFHRGLTWAFFAAVLAPLGCSGEAETEEDYNEEEISTSSPVRVTEVLGSTEQPEDAFIEIRNDSEEPLLLDKMTLRTGTSAKSPLTPAQVAGQTAEAKLEAHQLGLIVDPGMSPARIERAACERPVAATREALGAAHAPPDDILWGSIRLRAARRCQPVFTVPNLGTRLARASSVRVLLSGKTADGISAKFGSLPKGVSFERVGVRATDAKPSPLGATPGTRNFYSSDPVQLAGGQPPLRAMAASPWRADASQPGPIPLNPLSTELAAAVDRAKASALSAFYQLNEPAVIDALVRAKTRGADVQITTDAEFRGHEDYVSGFGKLTSAGIPLAFDVNEVGSNRAPLSHNKFMVLDGEWLWTGSFNPIMSETFRMHSDNAVLVRSKQLASLHTKEFQTLMGGKYGTLKRTTGLGGGGAYVDGAWVEARFSPGLTDVQLKARAKVLDATGDLKQACGVTLGNGRPIIESRYTNTSPCGGPLDLLYSEVSRATSSVYFMQFSLALPDLADLLVERLRAGVEVRGIVDATISTKPTPKAIADAGGDVRFTPNSDPECPAYVTPRFSCPSNPNKVWFHHKAVIIDYGTDHPVVITGSHNMSSGAEQQNDETLVTIRDRAIVEQYYRIFRDAFDHPQSLGPRRPKATTPPLLITKVLGATSNLAPQVIEIRNADTQLVNLAGLSIWNRRQSLPLSGELAPGQVLALTRNGDSLVPAGARTLALPEGEPFVGAATPLVVREADGTWVATFDPYTTELTLPNAADGRLGAWELSGLDHEEVAKLTTELLGVNTSPPGEKPTWQVRGRFSDWGDGYSVTPAGLLLWRTAQTHLRKTPPPASGSQVQ